MDCDTDTSHLSCAANKIQIQCESNEGEKEQHQYRRYTENRFSSRGLLSFDSLDEKALNEEAGKTMKICFCFCWYPHSQHFYWFKYLFIFHPSQIMFCVVSRSWLAVLMLSWLRKYLIVLEETFPGKEIITQFAVWFIVTLFFYETNQH